jgi:toxin ParE1/3/4
MYQLIIKDEAFRMIDEAYEWYELQLPGLGLRLLNELENCFKKLCISPLNYSIMNAHYRQLILRQFPYKIVYEVFKHEIIFYAVFHTARNVGSQFD